MGESVDVIGFIKKYLEDHGVPGHFAYRPALGEFLYFPKSGYAAVYDATRMMRAAVEEIRLVNAKVYPRGGAAVLDVTVIYRAAEPELEAEPDLDPDPPPSGPVTRSRLPEVEL